MQPFFIAPPSCDPAVIAAGAKLADLRQQLAGAEDNLADAREDLADAQAAIGERSAAVKLLGDQVATDTDDDVPDVAAATAAVTAAERRVAVLAAAVDMQAERLADAEKAAAAVNETAAAEELRRREIRRAKRLRQIAADVDDDAAFFEMAGAAGVRIPSRLRSQHARFGCPNPDWYPDRLRTEADALDRTPAPAEVPSDAERPRTRLAALQARDQALGAQERQLARDLPAADEDYDHRHVPAVERRQRDKLAEIADERASLAAAIAAAEAELAAVADAEVEDAELQPA